MTERLFTEDDLLTENFAEFETPTTTPEPGDTTMTRAQEEDPGPADGQDAEQSTGAEVVNLDKARAEKPKGIKRLAENHRARCAADIQPRDIDWFWKPYLPRGMLSLLDGDPGCGKSFITLAFAAALSTGRPFPGATGRPGKPRSSLICSAEDTAEEIIVPRLKMLGA